MTLGGFNSRSFSQEARCSEAEGRGSLCPTPNTCAHWPLGHSLISLSPSVPSFLPFPARRHVSENLSGFQPLLRPAVASLLQRRIQQDQGGMRLGGGSGPSCSLSPPAPGHHLALSREDGSRSRDEVTPPPLQPVTGSPCPPAPGHEPLTPSALTTCLACHRPPRREPHGPPSGPGTDHRSVLGGHMSQGLTGFKSQRWHLPAV